MIAERGGARSPAALRSPPPKTCLEQDERFQELNRDQTRAAVRDGLAAVMLELKLEASVERARREKRGGSPMSLTPQGGALTRFTVMNDTQGYFFSDHKRELSAVTGWCGRCPHHVTSALLVLLK